MALKQFLTQKLEQRLSPQQIQLMKLLQVPTMELEQRIKQEIEENPALEEGLDTVEDDFANEEDYTEELDGSTDFDLSEYMDDDSPDYKVRKSYFFDPISYWYYYPSLYPTDLLLLPTYVSPLSFPLVVDTVSSLTVPLVF